VRRVILLLVVLAVPAVLLALSIEGDKSYSFPEVRIDATVLPDGSIRLVEQRTFDFDGDFSFAFFTVDEVNDHVREFEVRERGQTLPFDETSPAGTFKAMWRFSATDERRTFRISYRVACAVDVYRDAAHLLWQFVGTGWEVSTDHAFIRVHLPEAAKRSPERATDCAGPTDIGRYRGRPLRPGETRAWGHGPLSGEVRVVDPQTVELEVDDIPPFTFVEGSILFPPEAVPTAAPTPGRMRLDILVEERRLAEIANDRRLEFLEEERRREAWTRAGWVAVVALPVLFALLLLIARLRDRVPGVPRIIPDPPEDIEPMHLVQLWGAYRGAVDARDAYRTQLLQLATSGAMEMVADGRVSDPTDIRVRLKRMPEDGSLGREFAEFLFVDGDKTWVSLKDIQPRGGRKTELREWWNKAKETGKRGFGSVRQLRWESVVTTALGLGGIALGLVLLVVAGLLGWLVAGVALVGMFAAHVAIPARPGPEFRERIARWTSFRRFLKSFSSLPDAPALAVVIWEHYLVYATALGVAGTVEKQVKALIPPQELPSPWPGAPAGVYGFGWVGAFHDSTPTQVASWVMPRATSSSSSSFGSFSSGGGFGGGFSGGGGGGGGGTGGGAG
jgi:uncharacterized membrane protein YgcG